MTSDESAPSPSRRERILDSATRAFAAHGYAAASLRDIAKDADCSLTLLNHHFGSKSDLLKAVVHVQHEHCHKRLGGLRQLVARPAFELEDFITTWATYEFDLYGTADGRGYINLMLRLQADREIDMEMRRTLNCSRATVMQGFARAYPTQDVAARDIVWRMTSSALYAAVTNHDHADFNGRGEAGPQARARAIAFLLHGLRGFCDCPEPEAPTLA